MEALLVCQKAADALKTMPTQTLETQVNLRNVPSANTRHQDVEDRDKMAPAPENWSLGKCLSESLGGYLKPAALSQGERGSWR